MHHIMLIRIYSVVVGALKENVSPLNARAASTSTHGSNEEGRGHLFTKSRDGKAYLL